MIVCSWPRSMKSSRSFRGRQGLWSSIRSLTPSSLIRLPTSDALRLFIESCGHGIVTARVHREELLARLARELQPETERMLFVVGAGAYSLLFLAATSRRSDMCARAGYGLAR